jgi:hypothetical protein
MPTGPAAPKADSKPSSLEPSQLKDFDANPPEVQALLKDALALTKQSLKYTYGSADPKNGGMDCSGTIFYLLNQAGVKNVPRQANQFYSWVRKEGDFKAVVSTSNDTFELDDLKPGDLLFWTGTYDVERDPPVTHVMIYLGRQVSDGKRVMVGASEGRRYNGVGRYGVSVYDFQLPGFPLPKGTKGDMSRFIGYGRIPGLLAPTAQPDSVKTGSEPPAQPTGKKPEVPVPDLPVPTPAPAAPNIPEPVEPPDPLPPPPQVPPPAPAPPLPIVAAPEPIRGPSSVDKLNAPAR